MFTTIHGTPIHQDIDADILSPCLDLDFPIDHSSPSVATFLCRAPLCSNLDSRVVEKVVQDHCFVLVRRHMWYSPLDVLVFRLLSEEMEEEDLAD